MCYNIQAMKKGILIATLAALSGAITGCDPSDGSKELETGREAYGLGDLKRADKMLSKSLELSPDGVDALLLLARVKSDLGETAAATNLAARAAAVAGDDADVRLVGAQTAWRAKDIDLAAKLFTSVANDTKLEPAIRAQGWTGLGVVEMSRERQHLARIAFMRAIRLDRRNAAAWYHLGLVYRDAFGYYEPALEQFEIFVRLETSAGPRVQRVQRTIIPALKDTIARETANRAGVSKRDSNASAASLAKAEAAWKKGSVKLARDAYQAALSSDPLSFQAASGLAKAWLKADTTKTGQVKALEAYKTACSLRPSAISTFLAAGDLAARLGYHAQAVEIFSRAVAASPASIQALDGLIRALQRAGGQKSAAQAYQLYRESIPLKRK